MADLGAATRAEQRSVQRLAQKRVILIEDEKRVRPPSVETLWSRAWYVLTVLPGREWQARRELEALGYDVFLPVLTMWAGLRFRTKRQVERALLEGYLFVGIGGHVKAEITDDDLNAIRGLRRRTADPLRDVRLIQSILGDRGGRPVRAPIENVVQLAGEVASGQYDETVNTFEAGARLLITKGVFASFPAMTEHAVPKEAAPGDAIAVIVKLFGRDTLMKIPLADLVPKS